MVVRVLVEAVETEVLQGLAIADAVDVERHAPVVEGAVAPVRAVGRGDRAGLRDRLGQQPVLDPEAERAGVDELRLRL